jgi:ABC-type microcin C transport system permease subunit YejB
MKTKIQTLFAAFVGSSAIVAVLLGLGGMMFLGFSAILDLRDPMILSVAIGAAISTLILTAYTYRMISDE